MREICGVEIVDTDENAAFLARGLTTGLLAASSCVACTTSSCC
jgi:hypothetical protein